MIKLHVTADDFGYCPQRNAGIIECFKHGGTSDTSLLVNCKYSEDAAKLGLDHDLPMGLHFNISEGKPVSDWSDVSSLLDSQHCFLGMTEGKAAAFKGKYNKNDVKTELRAQIERFKQLTGNYPRRVDGHQHFHVFPSVNEAFAEVLSEYKISLARIPHDLSIQGAHWLDVDLKEFLKVVVQHGKASRHLFLNHGVKSTDEFIGCSLMNFNSTVNLTVDHLKSAMMSLPSDITTVELMVHPGYPNVLEDGGCGVGPDSFSQDVCREWELQFLISKEFQDCLKENNFVIQSWES